VGQVKRKCEIVTMQAEEMRRKTEELEAGAGQVKRDAEHAKRDKRRPLSFRQNDGKSSGEGECMRGSSIHDSCQPTQLILLTASFSPRGGIRRLLSSLSQAFLRENLPSHKLQPMNTTAAIAAYIILDS